MIWQALAYLPNIRGFKFIGLLHNGSQIECYVERGEYGMHYVAGGASFNELKAWRRL